MPDYFDELVEGYRIYFTDECIVEALHAHASDKKKTKAIAAKIWVYRNGDTKVEKKGNLTDRDLNKICKYIKKNCIKMFNVWKDFNKLDSIDDIEFKLK